MNQLHITRKVDNNKLVGVTIADIPHCSFYHISYEGWPINSLTLLWWVVIKYGIKE